MYQMTASWLSADHTFKVSANIGFWSNGKWIKLYDSLFIVMNEVGVVLSWRLCKGTSFIGVEDLLQRLKDRLERQGYCISHFFVDNCCHWRAKLNSIFDSSLILLDPFHGIQRVTSKIPRKGTKGCSLRKLQYKVLTDFKLVIREPTDCGKKRPKPTPSTNIIEKDIANFLKQWNNVEYEGTKLIPRCAIDEINKLLTHVKKGCLSHIPPSGRTGRNEGFHRVLNKTLKKSRIGIQFAVALLGVFFYMWNEKQLSGDKTKKTIRVVPPVESHFEKPESSHLNGNEVFRLVDYSHLSGAETCANDTDGVTEANSTGGMMTKLNEWLNGGHVSDSSSDDDDNYSYCAKDSQAKSELPFAESQKELIDYSRSMEELWSHLESAGKFEKFQPKHVMFAKSGLTLLNSDLPNTREYSSLDGVLANYDMARVNIPGNGNCFFKSVAHAIKKHNNPNPNYFKRSGQSS